MLAARESIDPGDLAGDEVARLVPCPSFTADPPGCGAAAGSPCAHLAALGAAWAAQGRGGIVREPDDAAAGGAVDSDRGGDATPAIDLGALLAGVSAVFAGYDRLRVEVARLTAERDAAYADRARWVKRAHDAEDEAQRVREES